VHGTGNGGLQKKWKAEKLGGVMVFASRHTTATARQRTLRLQLEAA
jgi:hypothetical protein